MIFLDVLGERTGCMLTVNRFIGFMRGISFKSSPQRDATRI